MARAAKFLRAPPLRGVGRRSKLFGRKGPPALYTLTNNEPERPRLLTDRALISSDLFAMRYFLRNVSPNVRPRIGAPKLKFAHPPGVSVFNCGERLCVLPWGGIARVRYRTNFPNQRVISTRPKPEAKSRPNYKFERAFCTGKPNNVDWPDRGNITKSPCSAHVGDAADFVV